MGWCLYLINKTKGVYIAVGKTDKDNFIDYCESVGKALGDEFFDEDIIYEFDVSKISDITVGQLRKMLSAFRKIELIYGRHDSTIAALLYLKWKGDDMAFETDPDLSDTGLCEL